MIDLLPFLRLFCSLAFGYGCIDDSGVYFSEITSTAIEEADIASTAVKIRSVSVLERIRVDNVDLE